MARLIAALLFLGPLSAIAHEVPNAVTVPIYVKPEGQAMTVLLQVPTRSLRDIDLPLLKDGVLDLSRIETALDYASRIWVRDSITLHEDGERLPAPRLVAARIVPGTETGFDEGYDLALTQTMATGWPDGTAIRWEDGLLDLRYEYPIASERARFTVNPALTLLAMAVNVDLTYIAADGRTNAYSVHARSGTIALDPSPAQAAAIFMKQGVQRLLGAVDLLLLLICMSLAFPGVRAWGALACAYFVGQTLGIGAGAAAILPNVLWLPYLVALIVVVATLAFAIDNGVGGGLGRRWRLAIPVALFAGIGLWGGIGDSMQLAGRHSMVATFAFAAGASLAAAAVIAMTMAGVGIFVRYAGSARVAVIILSLLVAHPVWHLCTERATLLAQFPWPTPGSLIAAGAFWSLAAVAAIALAPWLLPAGSARARRHSPAE